jgi:hypothetical protein
MKVVTASHYCGIYANMAVALLHKSFNSTVLGMKIKVVLQLKGIISSG